MLPNNDTLPNDDLARWGEPPTDDAEIALAERLAAALATDPQGSTHRLRGDLEAEPLLEMSAWMSQLIQTVLEQTDLLAVTEAIDLRLTVSRALPGGLFQPIAASQAAPMMVRDLRRIPDNSDRVFLRTGERVRVEMICNRPGFLAVLNVGPGGNLNLLYPAPGQAAQPLRPREPVQILDIELIPPAGRERLYAIWTRQAVTVPQLASLIQPGAVLRDMVRVQETLDRLPPEDWHAVLLELDHQA